MDILQSLVDIVNGVAGLLNNILTFIEQLFAPVFNVMNRWNTLFGSGE